MEIKETQTQNKEFNKERKYEKKDRPQTGASDDKIVGGREKKKYFRKKVCYFCKHKQDVLDYKDVKLLRRYIKESGKIIPRRLNGSCAKHQRMITRSIKRSRSIALLPFEMKY